MGIFTSLNSEQKEATGILQIGTFLEYFDLLLYVHMAVVLNELFFPNTDPYTAKLITASGYCATFVFRPLGALVFGYMGDTIGRKPTIVATTILMAISCVVMATLPTYAKIGISASWAITICRVVQGMSSMGEVIGAEIYLTELVKSPSRYAVVSLLECASVFGGMMALVVATGVFAIGLEWRAAFWVGALVALAGSVARTALRETPDFVNAQNRLQTVVKEFGTDNETISKKTILAYFLIQCGYPVFFYFTYIYSSWILKDSFNYTAEKIIHHNLIVAAIEFLVIVFLTYLSCVIYPLKIIKTRMMVFTIFSMCIPYLLCNITSPFQLLLIQSFLCFFTLSVIPGSLIFFLHFPVFKRFTCASLIFSLSRALVSVITSFGLVYLTEHFNYWGLLIIFIPVCIGFIFGISHFEKLEKAIGNYY